MCQPLDDVPGLSNLMTLPSVTDGATEEKYDPSTSTARVFAVQNLASLGGEKRGESVNVI